MMCHVPVNVLKKMHMFYNACKNNSVTLKNCEICQLARQARLSFPNSMHRSTFAFQLIHVDVWGPYKCNTFDGMK